MLASAGKGVGSGGANGSGNYGNGTNGGHGNNGAGGTAPQPTYTIPTWTNPEPTLGAQESWPWRSSTGAPINPDPMHDGRVLYRDTDINPAPQPLHKKYTYNPAAWGAPPPGAQ